MEKYSILEAARLLNISKDTLRYYDKMGLICPQRGENKYRYFSEYDLSDLRYIEVMKYAGFSLKEIKKVLENKRECSVENLADTKSLMDKKRMEISKKIELYQYVLQLMAEARLLLENGNFQGESREMNALMCNIFNEMKGKGNEE